MDNYRMLSLAFEQAAVIWSQKDKHSSIDLFEFTMFLVLPKITAMLDLKLLNLIHNMKRS